jgi:hypothetical protein
MITWFMAVALGAETGSVASKPVAGHAVLDLRIGVLRTDPSSHPYVCLEGAPLAWLSVEGCGTGSGFLHHGDEPDLAHFRVRGRVLQRQSGRFDGSVLAGLGFAEAQRGVDPAGFDFGAAEDRADGASGAGPEASVSLSGRYWAFPAAYVIVDANAGAAVIPAAPTVTGQSGPVVPFAVLSAGLGF